jgi:hypothetical protein
MECLVMQDTGSISGGLFLPVFLHLGTAYYMCEPAAAGCNGGPNPVKITVIAMY